MPEDLDQVMRRLHRVLEQAARDPVPTVLHRREGRVVSVGDGVLRIVGLPDVGNEEILDVGGRSRAMVMALTDKEVFAISLDDTARIGEGTRVRATGAPATIDVGEALLGRVVDPLGRPLDGGTLKGGLTPMPLERDAPAIHERSVVHSPMPTGVLAVDAMFAIGRGQRELILGEEGTGKTSLALDAMVRQKDTGVICVWVAIGRRRAETWNVVETLRKAGVRFVVVAAFEDASPGLRTLAPYAGTAVAEYFAERGEHALVAYDDLSAQAVAWRELSLLLRRPPGREAYPGDVFYLHARLLERAAQLSPERGGGSITALPIASLEGGRLTAYIPTNLISITDGQLVLSRALFAAGNKPAVDAGLSVSRVGAKAQPQAIKDLAARLRLDYASFLELEAFSRLGTHVEPSAARRIATGRRLRGLLRAPRLTPLGVFAEVVHLVLASTPELLLRIPENDIGALARAATEACARSAAGVAQRVEHTGVLSEGDRAALLGELRAFVDSRHPEVPGAG